MSNPNTCRDIAAWIGAFVVGGLFLYTINVIFLGG